LAFLSDSTSFVVCQTEPVINHITVWKLARPLEWWSRLAPEFWLTLVLAIAMIWSLIHDRRIGARP
jgi:hypothetical protein